MPLRLGIERLQAIAAFKLQHRAELLAIVLLEWVGLTRLRQERNDIEALRAKEEHEALVREVLLEHRDSLEIASSGDRLFLAFSKPSEAARFALRLQQRLATWIRAESDRLGDRIAIHVGEIILETSGENGSIHGLNGLEVDRCDRLLDLAEPGRILLTRPVLEMARTALKDPQSTDGLTVRWFRHGHFRFEGLAEPMEVCEVAFERSGNRPPPKESKRTRRVPLELLPVRGITRLRFLVGSVLVALLGAILLAWEDGVISTLSYDLSYFLRTPEFPKEAVIIEMDPRSHDELNQDPRDGWKRELHGRLIEILNSNPPSAVVLDTLLYRAEPDQAAGNERLVNAARTNGRVIVAADIVKPDLLSAHLVGDQALAPFEALDAVVRSATVALPSTPHRIARRMHAAEVAGVRSLPFEVAAMLTPTRIPSPADQPVWLNFYATDESVAIPGFSYVDVLEGRVDPAEFANRIVFVGADYPNRTTPAGHTRGKSLFDDNWYIPNGNAGYTLVPGVRIAATACLNLLRGDGLRRLPGWIELLVVTLTSVVAVATVAMTRPLPGLGLATLLAGLVAYFGMASVWWTHVWFPWLIVAAVQLPTAIAWCALARLDRRIPASITTPDPAPADPPAPALASPSPAVPPKTLASPSPTPDVHEGSMLATPNLPTASIGSPPSASTSDIRKNPTPIVPPIIPDHEVLRLIDRGAYGEVWLCRSTNGLYRAVKVVRRANFEQQKPYEREFDGIRKYEPVSLTHPSLLAILHVGRRDAEGYFFYIMELGDDLHEGNVIDPKTYEPRNLARDLRLKKRLSVPECLALGERLGSALEVLHGAGLLHRDIKPANIIFLNGIPKLADPGLVTTTEADKGTFSFVGTMGYMAPEGPRAVTADIFSFGKVLYEAANGVSASDYPALPSDSLARPDWPEVRGFNELVFKACEMDPRMRFGSAADLREALRAFRIRRTTGSSPESPDHTLPSGST